MLRAARSAPATVVAHLERWAKKMAAITTTEKTKGKRAIMKIVAPFLSAQGFTKKSTYEYEFKTETGCGRLIMNIPTFDSIFRMFTSFEYESGRFQGPITQPFECPNHPGSRRFNFRFTHVDDTYPRCAEEIQIWISTVLIPWFKQEPKAPWKA